MIASAIIVFGRDDSGGNVELIELSVSGHS